MLPSPTCRASSVPFVSTRTLDPHQMGFAFGEALAHVNYLLRLGTLKPIDTTDGRNQNLLQQRCRPLSLRCILCHECAGLHGCAPMR
jgi:metallo-beta-lactamase-like protein